MDRPTGGRPLDILFVGTDAGAIRTTRASLRDAGVANDLTVLQDGPSALELLGDGGRDGPPDAILLDGDSVDDGTARRVLDGADTEETIVVTLGRTPQGVEGLTATLAKPFEATDLLELLLESDEVWLRVVTGPTRRAVEPLGSDSPTADRADE